MADVPKTLSSFAPVAGAGLGLVGSIIGGIQSSNNVNKQIEAQKKENQLNRQFNAVQAQLNRDYQSAQIADYRRYNSPLMQAKRLQEAGFHPSALLGNVQPSDGGFTSGAQAASSGGISPVGYQPFDPSAAARTLAETRLLNSQADKNDADARNANADAVTEDMMRSGKIVLQQIEIELGEWAKHMAPDQARLLKGQVLALDDAHNAAVATLDEINARTANLKEDFIAKRLDNIFASETFQTRIREMSARCRISEAQAKYAVARQIAELLDLKAGSESKFASAFQSTSLGKYFANKQELDNKEWDGFKDVRYTHSVLENRRMRYDLEMDETFEATERGLKIASESVGLAGYLFDDVMESIEDVHDTTTGKRKTTRTRRTPRFRFRH